jgi:hypothetical protein
MIRLQVCLERNFKSIMCWKMRGEDIYDDYCTRPFGSLRRRLKLHSTNTNIKFCRIGLHFWMSVVVYFLALLISVWQWSCTIIVIYILASHFPAHYGLKISFKTNLKSDHLTISNEQTIDAHKRKLKVLKNRRQQTFRNVAQYDQILYLCLLNVV